MQLPTTSSDPSGLAAAIGGLTGAVLALLVILGVIPQEVSEAVLSVVVAVLPVLTAFGIRRFAYAPDTVDRQINMIAQLEGTTPSE